ncbi:hypothetical protein DEO72_LG5g2001 [Vigna unguiculata]|uniref:Uncharacterized protein n=1 Tax=Vigna unguiculata TaxID=3917 RepID=A0A4D6M1J9_VIGUN|nr:hypothetical protein DEO72_LG5g2001 [Vigna unguiculata]
MSSSDSSSLAASSSSQSTASDRSRDDRLRGEGISAGGGTSGMPMEVVREVREDPPEELEESNWPAKGGYAWVASDVREQSSLFRWSRLLNSWLNCTPVISRGVSGDIVSLERVSAIDRAFRILCESLYLEPSPYAFLYFYDTRPRRPATWLSLISRPSISRLDAFSQSFKHFKDGYFKVVVKEGGHMAQSGKKNLALFQALRKEMAAKAKEVGKTGVPNLQESVVEVHVHGGTKRKAELPPRPGKGKDVKKVRAAILGSGDGAGSASGEKLPEAGLIELPEICVRKDISINLPDTVVNSIDNME